jgi:hypothetical protein
VDEMPGHSHHHPTDPPAAHGMAVLGEQAVYMSHLAMFMAPHDHQLVIHVALEGSKNPQQVYLDDRKGNPRQLYTFNPERFSLSSILPEGQHPPEATTFQGDLFRGHFERPDTKPVRIAADVTVRIKDIIHHHHLDPHSAPLEELRYLLFGGGPETFLAHVITAVPDYEQHLAVDIDAQFSDEELRSGIVVTFPGRPNTVAGRIKPGADVDVAGRAAVAGRSVPVKVRPKIEYYLETGDLAESM